MDISQQLKKIRKDLGYTQEEFARKLGIKRASVGAYEEGRANPNLQLLREIGELAGLTIDEITGVEEVKPKSSNQPVNSIPLIPLKAAAGYQSGFPDESYIQELPSITIPFLGRGDFRAFEISGDSMLPIASGTIIIGERIEKLNGIKDGKTYIVVTRNDGIVYKRVFNYLQDKGVLYMVSDNTRYKPYTMDPKEVTEVWASKAFISVDFPEGEA